MDIDLSDEEFVLPQQHVSFALTLPELDSHHFASVPATHAVSTRQTGKEARCRCDYASRSGFESDTCICAEEPETADCKGKPATFGRFAFKGRHSDSGKSTADGTVLANQPVIDLTRSVRDHSKQAETNTNFRSHNKTVRPNKRNININASIFDDSDDDSDATVDRKPPLQAHMQPDISKSFVSFVACASNARSYAP